MSLNALQTISTPTGVKSLNLPFLQPQSPVVSSLSTTLQNSSNALQLASSPVATNVSAVRSFQIPANSSTVAAPVRSSLVSPVVAAPAKMANGMHSPSSLVHSIYGKDRSENILKAAILSQPSTKLPVAQNVLTQAYTQVRSAQPVIQTQSQVPLATTSPSNLLLQAQTNQLTSLAQLNEKLLQENQQLKLQETNTSLLNSASQAVQPSTQVLSFSKPILSSNVQNLLENNQAQENASASTNANRGQASVTQLAPNSPVQSSSLGLVSTPKVNTCKD